LFVCSSIHLFVCLFNSYSGCLSTHFCFGSSVCLSICLSVLLSYIYLCSFISLSVHLFLWTFQGCQFVCPSVCLSVTNQCVGHVGHTIFLSISSPTQLFIHPYVCITTYSLTCLSGYPSVCSSVHLIYLSLHQITYLCLADSPLSLHLKTVRLSVYASICLFICPSVCRSFHLYAFHLYASTVSLTDTTLIALPTILSITLKILVRLARHKKLRNK